ncbi:MAG: secretion system protein Por, partial [Flavobacteriales bacterium]|nr:secretion system protein Por [Flavobacteriales bacterium]
CNINVICPEGIGWENEIRSVAIITVGGSGFCTGTLLNNCAQDSTPYFLTANHCLDANVENWVFRFNWDSPVCDPTENGPTDQTVSGCELLVNSGGTDVALLRLNSIPPEEY